MVNLRSSVRDVNPHQQSSLPDKPTRNPRHAQEGHVLEQEKQKAASYEILWSDPK